MKKEIMKKIPMFFASMFMVLIFTVLFSSTSVEAATAKRYTLSKTTSKLYFDLNGDNRKETLTFQLKKNSFYVLKTTVKINNKTALVMDYQRDSSMNTPHTVYVHYIPISSKVKLIGISGSCDGDYQGFNRIYRYDSKKKTLVKVLDLKTKFNTFATVTKTTSKGFYVRYEYQPYEIGRITWTFFYNYSNNKAKLSNKYATPKSMLGSSRNPYISSSLNTYYKNLYKQSKFKTDYPRKYTTTSTGTATAFTTKKGDIVTLKRICFTTNKIYLQFQKGSKRGWITLGQSVPVSRRSWYEDVTNRLAG